MSETIQESEGRRILRRIEGSLAEVVVMETNAGYLSQRTTCPDGQFWLLARGGLSIRGDVKEREQTPFDLAYYRPHQPASRLSLVPTLAYGLRIRFSKLHEGEFQGSWHDRKARSWESKRRILHLIGRSTLGASHLDEAVSIWLEEDEAHRPESSRAPWIRTVEDLLHRDPALSLLELSREVGVVPGYLSGEFRRSRGFTISTLKRRIMLQRAIAQSGSLPLNVAAIEAGFYDASHFHRACLSELAIKPSDLRSIFWPT